MQFGAIVQFTLLYFLPQFMHFAASLGGLVTCHEIIHIETPFHVMRELWVDFSKCCRVAFSKKGEQFTLKTT